MQNWLSVALRQRTQLAVTVERRSTKTMTFHCDYSSTQKYLVHPLPAMDHRTCVSSSQQAGSAVALASPRDSNPVMLLHPKEMVVMGRQASWIYDRLSQFCIAEEGLPSFLLQSLKRWKESSNPSQLKVSILQEVCHGGLLQWDFTISAAGVQRPKRIAGFSSCRNP